MTREHLGVIKALKIPFYIVLTKLDIYPQNVLERTTNEITRLVERNFNKKVVFMDHKDINLTQKLENLNINDDKSVKMFKLSNVTGEGLDFFRDNLLTLNNRINWNSKEIKIQFFG